MKGYWVLLEVANALREEWELDLRGDHSVSVPELAERIAGRFPLERAERFTFLQQACDGGGPDE